MGIFAIFGMPLGGAEILVLAVIGVLLFGRKLPEVGKYLGKSIVEFKKGMKGLEEGIDDSSTASTAQAPAASKPSEAIKVPSRVSATAPKFDDVSSNPPQV